MTTSRSAALVRRWVVLYTRGLPADVGDARREEIAADLWSQAHDAERVDGSAGAPAYDILERLLFGIWADITWRLDQRHRARVRPARRSLPMSTRIVAACSIIGGSALTATVILWAVLTPESPANRPWATLVGTPWWPVLTILGDGGLVLLSVGLLGVVFRFNERLNGGVVVVGSLGGSGGLLAAIGRYVGIILLPIGSMVVALDLARLGALPRSLSLAHAVAAIAFIGAFIATLTNMELGTARWILALAYTVTSIGIGIALLRSRLPEPSQRIEPTSAAPRAP